MNDIEIQLNKIAQGIVSVQSGIDWFDTFDLNEKKVILHTLGYILTQSRPTIDEITNGIEKSKLKTTYTPCVLMLKKPFKEAIAIIQNLPENEGEKSFILWLSIFSIADKRRRNTVCSDGCYHEWHNLNNL
jgi:hypothetical protein